MHGLDDRSFPLGMDCDDWRDADGSAGPRAAADGAGAASSSSQHQQQQKRRRLLLASLRHPDGTPSKGGATTSSKAGGAGSGGAASLLGGIGGMQTLATAMRPVPHVGARAMGHGELLSRPPVRGVVGVVCWHS